MQWDQTSQWLIPRDPSPRRAPRLHSAVPETTVASSRSPEHMGDLNLHPGPEGHHRELANMVRAEGAGVGGVLDKDPLVPKAQWQEARAKPLHLLPMVPGCPAVWVEGGILFLEPPPFMLHPLLLH